VSKLENIRDGWFNYIKSAINKKSLSSEFQEEAEKRASICTGCPELTVVASKGPLRGRCKKCGCTFPAMIYAPKKRCPIGKWDKFEKDQS